MNLDDQAFKNIVAEVLLANNVVDIIGRYVELKPSGSGRFTGLCPFHNEKTPSFTVNQERQAFYCFGCEKGGDAITFLREHEGMTFEESLQRLADRAGIEIPSQLGGAGGRTEQRSAMLDFGKYAAGLYERLLQHETRGKPGRDYLAGRGFKQEIIDQFGLGLALDEWSVLLDAARKKEVDESLVEVLGLAKRRDGGGLYDHFRNRLMFPIHDVGGHVVAFGGRDLGDSPAKYINSPENPVYTKGRVLYGLYQARDGMRRTHEAVLVEGYFDVLRCFEGGVDNAVATCGTALTADQANLIHRYAKNVLVVFDGDTAGIRAAIRSIGILIAAGLSVRAMVLPDGQDPDDYIKSNGGEAFRAVGANASHFVEFYVNVQRDRVQTIEGRTEVAHELFAIVAAVEDGIRQDEYVKKIAAELDINPMRCAEEFTNFDRDRVARARRTRREEPEKSETTPYSVSYDDRRFVSVLLQDRTAIEKVRAALDEIVLDESPMATLLTALFACKGEEAPLLMGACDAQQIYAAAAASETEPGEDGLHLVDARLVRFRRDALQRQSRELMQELERAQYAHDAQRAEELILKKMNIDREIDRVGAA